MEPEPEPELSPEPEPEGDDAEAAASRIQAIRRGSQTRAELQARQRAATKVQAAQRGKQARAAAGGAAAAEPGWLPSDDRSEGQLLQLPC